MALQNTSRQRTFKNTFAPDVKNSELGVHAIILGLKTTALDFKDLPPEVQDAVSEELERIKKGKRRKGDPATRAKI